MAKKFLRAKILHQNMPVILWGGIPRIAKTEGGGSEGVPAGGRMGCRGAVITPLVPPKKRVDTISDTDKTQ